MSASLPNRALQQDITNQTPVFGYQNSFIAHIKGRLDLFHSKQEMGAKGFSVVEASVSLGRWSRITHVGRR